MQAVTGSAHLQPINFCKQLLYWLYNWVSGWKSVETADMTEKEWTTCIHIHICNINQHLTTSGVCYPQYLLAVKIVLEYINAAIITLLYTLSHPFWSTRYATSAAVCGWNKQVTLQFELEIVPETMVCGHHANELKYCQQLIDAITVKLHPSKSRLENLRFSAIITGAS